MADRLTRSGNPGLNDKTFTSQPLALGGERMTLQGAINKSFLLLVVLMAAALYPWSQYLQGDTSVTGVSMLGGLIGGLVLGLIISFKPTTAPFLAIPYAACEGLALGAISAVLEHRFPGIAIQAVGLTFCVLGTMLALYSFRIIRATERLRAIVVTGTAALAVFYVVTLVLQAFFHVDTSMVMGSSPLSIGISLLAIGLAAMYLILDFDLIESGAARGVPRYMEWYSAFGLLMTLVWLYMEILRLLQNSRRS
ncbi:MAG TPA: Bax inhibitor-1/YccA family protein [Steroidobacteraceae bacterium]|nr:Bax inhibitor-1/YccA family protein [Steroidobacteraceae bacterium]